MDETRTRQPKRGPAHGKRKCTRERELTATAPGGRRIEPGLCLAIEPMFTLGTHEVRLKDDGWTVVTADGSLAAHWENTIAVTSEGPRILTEPGVTVGVPALLP